MEQLLIEDEAEMEEPLKNEAELTVELMCRDWPCTGGEFPDERVLLEELLLEEESNETTAGAFG